MVLHQMIALFGAVKFTKNADSDKYGYSDHGIGFDANSQFSLPNGEWGKNVFFRVNNSSSVDTDNTKKDILVLAEGQTQGLDDTL